MKRIDMRSGFSMITAIFVIVLMSTVAALIFSMSGKLIKETTAQYQAEQAALLANSYTEYAIMAVMANDRNGTGNCLRDIDGTIGDPSQGNGYDIRVRIAYVGNSDQIGSCATTRTLFSDAADNLATPLTIVVDVYVEYKEPDHHDIDNAPMLTFHRRTVQKI